MLSHCFIRQLQKISCLSFSGSSRSSESIWTPKNYLIYDIHIHTFFLHMQTFIVVRYSLCVAYGVTRVCWLYNVSHSQRQLKAMSSTAPMPDDVYNYRKSFLEVVLSDISSGIGSPLHTCITPNALQTLGYMLFNEHLAR